MYITSSQYLTTEPGGFLQKEPTALSFYSMSTTVNQNSNNYIRLNEDLHSPSKTKDCFIYNTATMVCSAQLHLNYSTLRKIRQ